LKAVKAPFRLIMTRTPLQNNVRELFNLLQYLEENTNATELEEKYAEMTSGTVIKLHAQMGIAQLPCRPQISRHN
jgi:chromodomain-helicase-DNA-binding protein 4